MAHSAHDITQYTKCPVWNTWPWLFGDKYFAHGMNIPYWTFGPLNQFISAPSDQTLTHRHSTKHCEPKTNRVLHTVALKMFNKVYYWAFGQCVRMLCSKCNLAWTCPSVFWGIPQVWIIESFSFPGFTLFRLRVGHQNNNNHGVSPNWRFNAGLNPCFFWFVLCWYLKNAMWAWPHQQSKA